MLFFQWSGLITAMPLHGFCEEEWSDKTRHATDSPHPVTPCLSLNFTGRFESIDVNGDNYHCTVTISKTTKIPHVRSPFKYLIISCFSTLFYDIHTIILIPTVTISLIPKKFMQQIVSALSTYIFFLLKLQWTPLLQQYLIVHKGPIGFWLDTFQILNLQY